MNVIRNPFPWVFTGIAVVCCVATIYSFTAYRDVVNKIVSSEQSSDLEDYEQAASIIESAKISWIVKSFGLKREIINDLSTEITTRKVDQRHYENGIETGIYDLLGGVSKLSEIASDSYYFDQAQIKIGRFRIQLLERNLDTANYENQKADEEIERLWISKKELETTLIEAESAATEANKRADLEESAKKSAQQDSAAQTALAEQREKERILVLANTHPMIQSVISGELKFYFETLPWYAAPNVSSGVEDIVQVLSAWNPYGATMRRVYSSSNADLAVNWVKDYGTHVLGESIYKSYIKVGLGTDNCRGDWMAFDADTVKKCYGMR